MQKYLFIGMLCMSLGGQFSASLAAKDGNAAKDVQKVKSQKKVTFGKMPAHKKSYSTINTKKADTFLSWYEDAAKQGKVLTGNVANMYEMVKNHPFATKNNGHLSKRAPALAVKPKAALKPSFAEAENKADCSCSDKKHHHAESCLKKHILECKDFGKKGVVITHPGYYCLSENVVFKPHRDHKPAITIRSDNVILDLSTHVLSQSPCTFEEFDNTSAIVVESGYDFVTIKNGQIKNFSNHGVIVLSDNLGSVDDHHGIVIEDLIVLDSGKITTATDLLPYNTRSGIGVYGTTDCVIQNCETSGITSLIDTEAIATFFCDNVLIKNCLSHANTSDLGQGFTEGIEVNFFNNAVIEGCTSIKNVGSATYGIVPVIGTSLTVRDCQANENSSPFFCIGIAVYNTGGGTLSNSHANFNTVKFDNEPNFCSGIQVVLSNIDASNCSANFNSAGGPSDLSLGAATGFDLNTVNGSTFINCSAEGNTNEAPGPNSASFGFIVDNTSNVLLEDCVAIGNNPNIGGLPASVAGFVATIHPEPGVFSNVIFKNCQSLNHSSDYSGTAVSGFQVGELPPTDVVVNANQIVLDGCIAEGNVNTGDAANGAGIAFGNGTTSSSVVNCILKGNGIGLFVSGVDTLSNLFENNQITANLVYGIQDTTGSNLNSYSLNYAYNTLSITNFNGLPTFTPIRTWQIGLAPSPVDNNGLLDPLDNIDVINGPPV